MAFPREETGATPWSQRRTGELQRGRLSLPGARYFVTFCTAERRPWLAQPPARDLALTTLRSLHTSGDARIHAATIMPDHVHLLFTLGHRLTLPQVIGSWKSTLRKNLPLPDVPQPLWQANYFEHRLRNDESAERYAWYLFMNPYLAGLISTDRTWPGWWTEGDIRWEFLDRARPGPTPHPEWLREAPTRPQGLTIP